MLSASAASAGPTIDFSTIPGPNPLGSTASLGGVNIKAFANGFAIGDASHLWVRSEGPSEDGLGVCSEGTAACNTGGDVNEVSNQENTDWLVLNRPADDMWSGVWVSSLDFNGSGLAEKGTLYWSNTLGDLSNSVSFDANDVTGANGDIFALLTAAGFDPFANFLMFRAGPGTAENPTNNDYLVWGVDLTSCLANCPGTTGFPTPEPLTLSIFGMGLAGAALLRRRRKTSA